MNGNTTCNANCGSQKWSTCFCSKLSFLPPYSIAQLQSFSNVCMKHNVALILHSLLVSDNFMAYHSIAGTFELTYFCMRYEPSTIVLWSVLLRTNQLIPTFTCHNLIWLKRAEIYRLPVLSNFTAIITRTHALFGWVIDTWFKWQKVSFWFKCDFEVMLCTTVYTVISHSCHIRTSNIGILVLSFETVYVVNASFMIFLQTESASIKYLKVFFHNYLWVSVMFSFLG